MLTESRILQLIVLRSNLGNLDIGTSASAWKTATVKVSNGKYTEKI
ncbi:MULTISPECIES: hypothetical protein [unclassified Microcoleus]|nr:MULTISPECIES: hypothetical protein [unclassified Microcoleus]